MKTYRNLSVLGNENEWMNNFFYLFYSLMKYPTLTQRRPLQTLQTNKEARLTTTKKFNILTNWITTWHHLLLLQFQTHSNKILEQNPPIKIQMERENLKTTLLNNNHLTINNNCCNCLQMLLHHPRLLLTRTKTNLKIRWWNCWAKCQRRMPWMLAIY